MLFVSLLVMPNLYLFYCLNTGMDLYGFFTLEPTSAYPLPLVLSTLLSSGMAVADTGSTGGSGDDRRGSLEEAGARLVGARFSCAPLCFLHTHR